MTEPLAHGVRLIVAYDGTDFCGWQEQPGRRTVQGTLGAAVHALTPRHSRVGGASRTDSGVHALGQVAAFACDRQLPAKAWMHELNAHLPDDVSVQDAELCAPDYEPRHDATGKVYHYLLRVGRTRDPLTRHRAWQVGPQLARPEVPRGLARPAVQDYLDLEAMAAAATHMVGTHDFRAFQASNDYREQTVRTMRSVRVVPARDDRDDLLTIEVQGDAFLKNMVRIMAGTLVDVGRRRLRPDDVPGLLTPEAERGGAGVTAPAHGLTLVRVDLGRART